RRDARPALDEICPHVVRAETTQLESRRDRFAEQLGEDDAELVRRGGIDVTVRGEDEYATRGELPRNEQEQQQRRWGGPVEGVEEEQEGRLRRRCGKELRHRVEEPEPPNLGLDGRRRERAGKNVPEVWHLSEVRDAFAQLVADMVTGHDVANALTQRLCPRPV